MSEKRGDEIPIISCRVDYARYRSGFHHVETLQTYSHSGFEEPRGTSTVRNEPGVLDITICSVIP